MVLMESKGIILKNCLVAGKKNPYVFQILYHKVINGLEHQWAQLNTSEHQWEKYNTREHQWTCESCIQVEHEYITSE